jgi:hypothetical protein
LGSCLISRMQADERIRSEMSTPHRVLPGGVSNADLSTLVIEVGLSQLWAGVGGLDLKARRWFDIRHHITDASYKLYDVAVLGVFFSTPWRNTSGFERRFGDRKDRVGREARAFYSAGLKSSSWICWRYICHKSGGNTKRDEVDFRIIQ